MAVRLWTSYNAAFEIAARCQLQLSKVCSFHLTNSSNFEVTLHTTQYAAFSPCLITIGFSKKEEYRDKIHVVFDDKLRLDEMERYQLDGLAYDIGNNIAERYGIMDAAPNHFVYFLEKDYADFEDEYEINYDNKTETIKTDYPLYHYMVTEFEAESVLSNEKRIKVPFTSLKRNGRYLFTPEIVAKKPYSITITITKKQKNLSVSTASNKNIADDWLLKTNIVSIIHSLGDYGYLKTFEQADKNGNCSIILSGNSDSYVRIERIRNYGLTATDILDAIPLLEKKLNLGSGRDWANYFSL